MRYVHEIIVGFFQDQALFYIGLEEGARKHGRLDPRTLLRWIFLPSILGTTRRSCVYIDDADRLTQLKRIIRHTVQSVTSDVFTRMLQELEYQRHKFRKTK